MKIIFIIMALISTSFANAQVSLNISLNPIVSLEMQEDNIRCKREALATIITIPLETFIVPYGEVLRFELLHLDGNNSYTLSYNKEDNRKVLTRENPYFFVYPNRGTQNHVFKLKITNSLNTSCESFKNHIRLTLEPM